MRDDRASTKNGCARLVPFESRPQGVAADPELIRLAQENSHPGAQGPAVVQDRDGGAEVLDPVAFVAMEDLRLDARDHPLGIGQGEGDRIGATQGAATLIETTDERLTHRLLVERDTLQD